MGCYHDQKKSQCVSLLISTDNETNINLQEIQKANQYLSTVSCFDKSLGLNRIICGSITTKNVFCRWQQNSCKFMKKEAIANIPCTDLKYANPSTCAQVKYNNEFCRYFKEEKGCTNQLKGEMNCIDLGLNTISCKQAKENCYFDNDRCQSIGEISTQITPEVQIILEKLTCQSNFPTIMICLEIQTKGQLCQWSIMYQQCRDILVLPNKKCSDFSSFQVNVNVCASITMENPNNIIFGMEQSFEGQNPGYCEYDRTKKICKVKTKDCTSECCTENEEIGINVHSCSRFSSKNPGVYCYFKDFRCQQLTNQNVDISNPNNVKSYYNEKKFNCAQMNKNSCHMIDWVNFLNLLLQWICLYLIEFTKPSSILNIYACLAIEAVNSINLSQKYFEYNQEGKNCKLLLQPYPLYQTCESVTGNSNICLGLTSNLYCKWNKELLKCVTITEDQQQEILTCNEYQNIKSCLENQYSACQFSLAQDKCINAPLDQDCSYFNTTGKVSRKTCSLITKSGQICEFQDNYCVVSNKSIEGCNLDGINKRGCFKNTKGNCRWDDVSGQCYENKTVLQELELTKQPCMWNDDQYQCVYFNQMTKDQYLEQNPKNQYNQWACTLIVGAGYTFDADNHKCKLLDNTQNFGCSDIQMNNYACQFLTKGSNCYFDQNEKTLQNVKFSIWESNNLLIQICHKY
ncbi:unnamed protein product (macronuclear) [Paramecium tetraurelia]|uniref:Transmembrane protein n=1 Tax=Paramecium tetraurelia TaxID=5888 RepID=A0CHQ8_PARTE|nr:uncharacterized protein GSPATT00038427001 [Paramecium tetraurelia]CAK70325.1 unnamed protein product [Paramecium tetraurelia]|eukprot:XP_001437722.1 hypothetical protein (macronuclear) [Paramecium tetraurelia strain d4-2]